RAVHAFRECRSAGYRYEPISPMPWASLRRSVHPNGAAIPALLRCRRELAHYRASLGSARASYRSSSVEWVGSEEDYSRTCGAEEASGRVRRGRVVKGLRLLASAERKVLLGHGFARGDGAPGFVAAVGLSNHTAPFLCGEGPQV